MDLRYPEAWPRMDVAVRMNGIKLPISPIDGCIELRIENIGRWDDLVLEVAGNESNIPFLVNRERKDKPVTLCRDQFGYREIRVRRAKGKESHYKTDPHYNNIRLLSLDYDPTSPLSPSPDYSPTPLVFTVAIISQGRNLFVTCDPTLEFGEDPDKKVWTCYTEWKSLDSKIFEITRRKVVRVDRKAPDFHFQENENIGYVFWWDSSRGVGLVLVWYKGEKVEASVYWAEIQKFSRRAYLVPKGLIFYKEVITKRNPSGRNSDFKFELRGVKVI